MSVLYLKKWKVIRLRGLWTGYWSNEILDNLIKQRAYFGQDQSTKFNEALTFRDGICHLHDPDDERKHLLKFCPSGAWLPSPWLWSILALVSRKPWKMSWAVMGDVIKYINLPSHSTKNTYSTREESQAGVFPLAIQHIDCLLFQQHSWYRERDLFSSLKVSHTDPTERCSGGVRARWLSDRKAHLHNGKKDPELGPALRQLSPIANGRIQFQLTQEETKNKTTKQKQEKLLEGYRIDSWPWKGGSRCCSRYTRRRNKWESLIRATSHRELSSSHLSSEHRSA